MPRHFWRTVVAVLGVLAAYAGFVKHDGTFCHDVVRTGFGTDTGWGKARFLTAVGVFCVHILRWPADRPRPSSMPRGGTS
jgi:hypothetical protein